MLTKKQTKKFVKIVLIILVINILKKKHIGRRLDINSMLSAFEYVNEIIRENPVYSIEILV